MPSKIRPSSTQQIKILIVLNNTNIEFNQINITTNKQQQG